MDGMNLPRCISSYFLLFVFLSSFAVAETGKSLVYVGTYTQRGSKGIYVYRYDAASGALEDLGLAAKPLALHFSPSRPTTNFCMPRMRLMNIKDNPAASSARSP